MISVIIPVYNTERYVGRCIESVLASEYTDYELLLIDDGSTDLSFDICREYSEKDSRIKLICQKHAGVSAARNRGIEESRGEWLVFVDSDDLISGDFLYTAAKREHEEYDLLLFDFACARKRKKRRIVSPLPALYYGREDRVELIGRLLNMGQLVRGGNTSLCSPCAKAYRRSVIERYSIRFPEDIIIGEDRIFNIKYLLKMRTCLYLQKPVYFIKSRPDSAMHGFQPDFLENDIRYQERLSAILKEEQLLPLLKRAYYSSVLTNMADVLIRGIYHPCSTRTDGENIILCRRMHKSRIYAEAMRYAGITGRMPARILMFFLKIKCYRVVRLICQVSFRVLRI